MTDLADLSFDVAGDLPAQVRKVIDTAVVNGWELNKPGMTLALRLNHPTDELAEPVYIIWAVGRTEKTGRLSFRFVSCGTRGLVPLSGADLLVYLADPTVAYTTPEEAQAELDAKAKTPPWDEHAPLEKNLKGQLGAQIIGIEAENTRKPRKTAAQIMAEAKGKPSAGLRVTAPPLKVQAP